MSKTSKIVGFGLLGFVVLAGGCTAALVGGAAVAVSEIEDDTFATVPTTELAAYSPINVGPEPVAEAPTEEPAEAPVVTEPAMTAGQRNAVDSASGYLSFTSFSRSGLIDQLEFEGYSTDDATYAVDSLQVDWNDQAIKSARDYLSFTSFSRSGLVDQLEFEGFTAAQAEHGVAAAY